MNRKEKILYYELKKMQNKLAELDANFLVGNLPTEQYKKKREGMKKIFKDMVRGY
jgi:hypothetical protein